MNKHPIFETSIIGFLIGIVISAYNAYLVSINSHLGNILNWVFLRELLNKINLNLENHIIIEFLFFIIVSVIYGIIVGFIIKKTGKTKTIVLIVTMILICGLFEQYIISQDDYYSPEQSMVYYAIMNTKTDRKQKKYFGLEARGDLNNDSIDDIAFIIHRNDKDHGILYYISSAINTNDGYNGTNLLYIGDKIEIKNITINDNKISVEYLEQGSAKSKSFNAKVENSELIEINN